MVDHPLTPAGRRTKSPSRNRVDDELLSRLHPKAAADALRDPSGSLKVCLEEASAVEQAFAIRTAIASQRIWNWYDELRTWQWPSAATGSSAGFEVPSARRQTLVNRLRSAASTGQGDTHDQKEDPAAEYLGCLPAEAVRQYENRIQAIQHEMDELDLEEIKTLVMHNHILPLSRPGTPAFSDGGFSVSSSILYTKMEDLTAVVTTVVVQALPILSKLTRLLNIWTIRLSLLSQIPGLLESVADAEVALASGWSAIEIEAKKSATAFPDETLDTPKSLALSRSDYEVMKSVLQRKVEQPGRDLDRMLDALEGMEDTLPDEWLDRVQAVEYDYATWVATAERRVREAELGSFHRVAKDQSAQRLPKTPPPKIQVQMPSPTKEELEDSPDGLLSSPLDRYGQPPEGEPPLASNTPDRSQTQLQQAMGFTADQEASGSGIDAPRAVLDLETPDTLPIIEIEEASDRSAPSLSHPGDHYNAKNVDSSSPSQADEQMTSLKSSVRSDGSSQVAQSYDGFDDSLDYTFEGNSEILSEVDGNILRLRPDYDPEYSVLESVNEEEEEEEEGDDEPQLPPTRFLGRKISQESVSSVVFHRQASGNILSDDFSFREESIEPELPRLPDPNEPLTSDGMSPPSSPPEHYKQRSTSVTFNDQPEVAPSPELDTTPPKSPSEPPEVFEPDTSFDRESLAADSSMLSTASDSDLLHRQISEVLESIPAKIRLTSKPSAAINLNPPDLVLPSRPRTKTVEPFRRSGSAMSTVSSRASTPGWLMAPEKHTRPRSKNSQEAKAYYLSRASGEHPIKLLIRCVGENGERVMVRVGGGWADLGEYLKDYATHHGRRSKGEGKVEVKDLPTASANPRVGSSPSSRPGSALESPLTPLAVRKTRKSPGEEGSSRLPKTPLGSGAWTAQTPPSDGSSTSRPSSRIDWNEETGLLGLAGPAAKKNHKLTEESKAWVDDVKAKVRTASGERMALDGLKSEGKLAELGKVGGTKRVFRKGKA